jgi:hypothetical protein
MIVVDQQDGPLMGGHKEGSHELRVRGEFAESFDQHHTAQARR